MKKGDWINTPRFLQVQIQKVFQKKETAIKAGFTEPTYYDDFNYGVLGKSMGVNTMIFAGYKKERDLDGSGGSQSWEG